MALIRLVGAPRVKRHCSSVKFGTLLAFCCRLEDFVAVIDATAAVFFSFATLCCCCSREEVVAPSPRAAGPDEKGPGMNTTVRRYETKPAARATIEVYLFLAKMVSE